MHFRRRLWSYRLSGVVLSGGNTPTPSKPAPAAGSWGNPTHTWALTCQSALLKRANFKRLNLSHLWKIIKIQWNVLIWYFISRRNENSGRVSPVKTELLQQLRFQSGLHPSAMGGGWQLLDVCGSLCACPCVYVCCYCCFFVVFILREALHGS